MKKVLAVILTAVLCIAASVLPISAVESKEFGSVDENYLPEGTPVIDVSSLTDPNGSYYLTGDIEITETIPVTFTGTIDGCGYTVTVSAPIFKSLSGTVKNLKIKGEVSGSSGDLGALACNVTGSTAKFENISNAANVTGTASAAVGGLVGRVDGNGTVFENIVNSGTVKSALIAGGVFGRFTSAGGSEAVIVNNVHNTGAVSGKHRTGGICGYINNSVTAYNLSNSGAIVSDGSNYAGGLFGFIGGAGSISSVTSSKNTGTVTGKGGASAGGIVGFVEECSYEISSCVNYGDVSANLTQTSGEFSVGGIIGLVSAAGLNAKNCINFGAVSGSPTVSFVGGVIGSVTKRITVTNCMNSGALSGRQVGGAVGRAISTNMTLSYFTNSGDITYQYGSPFIGYCGGIASHALSNCIGTGEFTVGVPGGQLCVYGGNVSATPTNVSNIFCKNVTKYCGAIAAFPNGVNDCTSMTAMAIVEAANAAAGSGKDYVLLKNDEIVLKNYCESHIDFDSDSTCDICNQVYPFTGDRSVGMPVLVCIVMFSAIGAVAVFIALRKRAVKCY